MISTDIKFGEFATFKYGKMPIKTKIKEVGQYPIFSGYSQTHILADLAMLRHYPKYKDGTRHPCLQ